MQIGDLVSNLPPSASAAASLPSPVQVGGPAPPGPCFPLHAVLGAAGRGCPLPQALFPPPFQRAFPSSFTTSAFSAGGLVVPQVHLHQQAHAAGLRDVQHRPPGRLRGPLQLQARRNRAVEDPAGAGGDPAVPTGTGARAAATLPLPLPGRIGPRQGWKASRGRADPAPCWEAGTKPRVAAKRGCCSPFLVPRQGRRCLPLGAGLDDVLCCERGVRWCLFGVVTAGPAACCHLTGL